jgi:hypothetical protein
MAKERLITATFKERALDYKQPFDQIHAIVHKYPDQNTEIMYGGGSR